MQMVKGCHQLNMFGQQHAVAKYVAAHIANTNYTKILLLNIHADFTEVALHCNPGSSSRNAHTFVVVAIASA